MLNQLSGECVLQGKWLPIVLLVLLSLLQYRLWFGKNSIPDYFNRKQEVQAQALQNANLAQRNALLKADINDLKIGLEAIEERARNELGLIKKGETFYRILPADTK
jgi:cell division protein FtsB